MTLRYSGVDWHHREILLKDKPREMLELSPKGTVPVLLLPDGTVLDESLAVMDWALSQRDPDNWRSAPVGLPREQWLAANDGPFKHWLDRYKYGDRFPERPSSWYRLQALNQLMPLEAALSKTPWLHGDRLGFCDVALFPFVRQFAMVDRDWFDSCELTETAAWLRRCLALPLFASIMVKQPVWRSAQ